MTSHRKLLVLAGVIVVVALAFTFWPRPRYTYQGKTVEEWFESLPPPGTSSDYFSASSSPLFDTYAEFAKAFEKMGTNAVPFLVDRYAYRPSPIERLAMHFRPSISARRDREKGLSSTLLLMQPHEVRTAMVMPMLRSEGVKKRFLEGITNYDRPISPLP